MISSFIQIKHAYYTYPDNTNAIVDATTSFDEGETAALIGQNGSGKTTLAKLIKGLLKPTRGEVLVDGKNVKEQTVAQLSQKVGYVFQNPSHQIFSMTIFDEVGFGLKNLKVPEEEIKKRVATALNDVGLQNRGSENPLFLSKGEKQRVAIASVMVMKPKVLILDEPTTGQDWRNIVTIMDLVSSLRAKYNQTSIIITHNMHVVSKWAPRSVVMADSKVIYDGDTRSMFFKPDVLSTAFITPTAAARLGYDFNFDSHPITAVEFVRTYELTRKAMV